MVAAKESDVTERMIHTGGELIQGNETRNFRDRGPRIGEKKRGRGWASWTAQALFAWTRTRDEPRRSGTYGCIAAGLLCAALTFQIGAPAPARFWTVGAKASHGNGRLLDACFRVFARCAKKKIFNSFTSFSR